MNTKVKLIFEGCGGLYHYYNGICANLQDNFDIKEIHFETSSLSGLGPVFLNNNLPMLQQYKLFEKRKTNLFNNNSFLDYIKYIPFLIYNHLLESYNLENKLNVNEINHTVKVRDDDKNNIEMISEYKNKEDYLVICVASSFIPIPFITNGLYSVERNKYLYDGSLDKYWYLKMLLLPFYYIIEYIKYIFNVNDNDNDNEIYNNEKIINVEIEILNEYILPIQYILYIYYIIIGYFSNQGWLYSRGYCYAEKHLKPKLEKLNIKPRPDAQPFCLDINDSLAKFKIKYDIKREEFI